MKQNTKLEVHMKLNRKDKQFFKEIMSIYFQGKKQSNHMKNQENYQKRNSVSGWLDDPQVKYYENFREETETKESKAF
jgi:hypothetical protein